MHGLPADRSRKLPLIPRLDLGRQRLDGGKRGRHRPAERRFVLAERALEPSRRGADLVEIHGRREPWRRADRALERERRFLGIVDAGGILRQPQRDQPGPQLLEVAAARGFLRDLAQGRDRDDLANERAVGDRLAVAVEDDPAARDPVVRAEVEPAPRRRLRREHGVHALTVAGVRNGALRRESHVLLQAHGRRIGAGVPYDALVQTVVQIAFAVAVVAAAAGLAAAALERIGASALRGLAGFLWALSAGSWIAFAVDLDRDLAVAAAGATVCALLAVSALLLSHAARRSRRIDAELERAQGRLRLLIEKETATHAGELEHLLSRARADSISLLAEEERRIADERRNALTERERAAGQEFTEALAAAQRRVEQRLAEWREDLVRAQAHLADQLKQLTARQQHLVGDAEARIAADADRLAADSETQRAALAKVREDLQRSAEETLATASTDLEAHAIERRRALHELNERLRRRERELRERLEREESDAVQRIQAIFTDIERRLVERLERVVERTTAQHAEAATVEFADAIKRSREDAARRLARELERAVAAFAHQAEGLLTERLSNVGEGAAQRLERQLTDATTTIERHRDELVDGLEQRLVAVEADFRRRLDDLVADSEAERGVLEARLHELSQRIEQALAQAQDRLSALER